MGGKDSGIEKLCESMQRMLAQLLEQAHTKSSNVSDILKISMEPNPVKLSGPGDYFSWARNATLILGAHGLQNFLEEDGKKSGDMSQEQWEQNQKRVMVWLLGSMEKVVREQVENLQTAAEVWKYIEKQFSGKSNKMQVSRILQEMRYIRQGQKSVTEYAGELKKLYRDLEFFRPFKPHDPRDLPLLREWFEPLLVQTFLDGLNPEFQLRSEMLLAMPNWPTLEEAVASILEEETRLSNKPTSQQVNADTRAALSSVTRLWPTGAHTRDRANTMNIDYKRRSEVICDNCKKPGHVKQKCFDLIGYPPGWQRKQPNQPNSGSNQQRKKDKVHFTSAGRESPATAAHALEEFKAKLMNVSTEGSSEASNSNGAEGSEVRKSTWDWN